MTDVSSPTEMFDSLACAFADAGIRTSPAELHGVAVGLLSGQADTAPAQVLSALASHAEVSAFDGGAADVLVAALERVPLAALSVMCLLDRTLKHLLPERRDAHVERKLLAATQASC